MPTADVQVRCPHCQAVHAVAAAQVGRDAECGSCGRRYTLARAEPAAAPPPDAVTLEAAVRGHWERSVAPGARLDVTIKAPLAGAAADAGVPGPGAPVTADTLPRRRVTAAGGGIDTRGSEFVLLSLLGKGGMGLVYRARQTALDRDIALKMIRPEVLVRAGVREKFLLEALVTGDLDHPNIIPIHDVGQAPDGCLFYTMKEVRGTAWSKVLSAKSLDEDLEILLRVADAVAFAHAKGVIHRDLKPDNVMLGDFGEVMVMDWGLAVSVDPCGKAESLVTQGGVAGTPSYMAPEMARGQADRIGPASDIYLLGGMLYEIVTGLRPHTGGTAMDCIVAAARNTIQPTLEQGELVRIARRALATDPQDRYPNVKALQQAIRDYRTHAQSITLTAKAQARLARATGTPDGNAGAPGTPSPHPCREGPSALPGRLHLPFLHRRRGRAPTPVEEAAAFAGRAPADADERSARVEQRGSRGTPCPRQGSGDGTPGTTPTPAAAETSAAEPRARAVDAYHECTEAIAGYRQALELWGANTAAVHGLRQAREALLEFALARGDLALAQSQVDAIRAECGKYTLGRASMEDERPGGPSPEPRHPETADPATQSAAFSLPEPTALAERVRVTVEQAARRERLARRTRAVALAAAAVALLVSVTAYWVTKRQRDRAEQALREKEVAQAGEAAAKEARTAAEQAKAVIEEAKAEVEQMKRREAYISAIAQAARLVEGRQFEMAEALLRETPPELRHWEWGRLMHLCHPELLCIRARLPGTSGGASTPAALSPDGRTILTGGGVYKRDGAIVLADPALWDAATGHEIRRLVGHPGAYRVAFSPDGELALTVGAKVMLWSTRTGTEKRTPLGRDNPTWEAAFSGDGKRVATFHHGDVEVWDVAAGRLTQTLPRKSGDWIILSPAGERLAVGYYPRGVVLWDVDSGREVWRTDGRCTKPVAFSSDGARVLATGPSGVAILDAQDGREILTFAGYGECAAFSPDGKQVVTGHADNTVRVWDATTGKQLAVFVGHGAAVRTACFFPDGKRILTAGLDDTVRIWDVRGHPECTALSGGASSAAFTPDGERIVTVGQRTMLWDALTGRLLKQSEPTPAGSGMALAPDGQRLASADGMTIRLWDLAECRELSSFGSGFKAGHIPHLAWSPDGKLLAGPEFTSGGPTTVWDPETGKVISAGAIGGGDVAFLRDGRLVAANGTFDPRSGQFLTRWPGLVDMASLALSLDGRRLLTGHTDRTARLWDLGTQTEIARLRGHAGSVFAVAFSPDGRRLLTGSPDRTVRIWDSETGRELFPIKAGTVWSLCFSPDGMRLLVPDAAGPTKVYDAEDWRLSPEELEKAQLQRYQAWLAENGPAPTPAGNPGAR